MKRRSSILCHGIFIVGLLFPASYLQSSDDGIDKERLFAAIVTAGCVYYTYSAIRHAHKKMDDHRVGMYRRSVPSVSEQMMNGLSDILGIELIDYHNDLKKDQDENGDTVLHHLAKKSILWTAEECEEKAPEVFMTFYKNIYHDDNLRDEDVFQIMREIEEDYKMAGNRKYLQFLGLVNSEGKTAKDILITGNSEGCKQLLNHLEAEEKRIRG